MRTINLIFIKKLQVNKLKRDISLNECIKAIDIIWEDDEDEKCSSVRDLAKELVSYKKFNKAQELVNALNF